MRVWRSAWHVSSPIYSRINMEENLPDRTADFLHSTPVWGIVIMLPLQICSESHCPTIQSRIYSNAEKRRKTSWIRQHVNQRLQSERGSQRERSECGPDTLLGQSYQFLTLFLLIPLLPLLWVASRNCLLSFLRVLHYISLSSNLYYHVSNICCHVFHLSNLLAQIMVKRHLQMLPSVRV